MQPANVPLLIDFYNRSVIDVAQDLLGQLLYRRSRSGLTVGRIVETEAYLAVGDPAAHSHKGRNRKNATMFGLPGRAYVYTIHARQCVNVVTEAKGIASAVLIRAVEPLAGLELMHQRRGTDKLRNLCRGPARLCEAFKIGRNLDAWNLTLGKRLWISAPDGKSEIPFHSTSRIGVTSAKQMQLRFVIVGSSYASGPAWLNHHSR